MRHLLLLTATAVLAIASTAAAARPTAAQRYGWGKPGWSEPFNGTKLAKGWAAYDSEGHAGNGLRRPGQIRVAKGVVTLTGTANARSAGMVLDTRRARYGRWETRLRAQALGTPGRPYHAVLALIPAGNQPYHCGATDVHYAEFDLGEPPHLFVHALPDRQDYASLKKPAQAWHDYAVEITPKGVSWFVDGRVVVTQRDPKLVSRARLSVNLQLDAYAPRNLQPARLQAAWTRYYPLRGRTLPPAPAPETGRFKDAC